MTNEEIKEKFKKHDVLIDEIREEISDLKRGIRESVKILEHSARVAWASQKTLKKIKEAEESGTLVL